jgi:hypothetical protein
MSATDRRASGEKVVYLRDRDTGVVTEVRTPAPHWTKRPVFIMFVVAGAFLAASALRLAFST